MSENKSVHFVAMVADNLLDTHPRTRDRAAAELLQCLVSTWEQQPGTVRKQAVATASVLARSMMQ